MEKKTVEYETFKLAKQTSWHISVGKTPYNIPTTFLYVAEGWFVTSTSVSECRIWDTAILYSFNYYMNEKQFLLRARELNYWFLPHPEKSLTKLKIKRNLNTYRFIANVNQIATPFRHFEPTAHYMLFILQNKWLLTNRDRITFFFKLKIHPF